MKKPANLTDEELKNYLEQLRDYIKTIPDYWFTGMCRANALMGIPNPQWERVRWFLEHNKPNVFKRISISSKSANIIDTVYWWEMGDKIPRIEWLNKQIKSLS